MKDSSAKSVFSSTSNIKFYIFSVGDKGLTANRILSISYQWQNLCTLIIMMQQICVSTVNWDCKWVILTLTFLIFKMKHHLRDQLSWSQNTFSSPLSTELDCLLAERCGYDWLMLSPPSSLHMHGDYSPRIHKLASLICCRQCRFPIWWGSLQAGIYDGDSHYYVVLWRRGSWKEESGKK